MSAPTAPAPAISYALKVTCTTCNTVLYDRTMSTEADFRAESAKALTVSELHDCRSDPKK
jgi:hypothetical protein